MKVLNRHIDLKGFFKKAKEGTLLMLDYDGTLAPFVTDRMEASPYPGVKECLQALMKNRQIRVVIVSGRCLSDLEQLLKGISHVELWGSHGLERKLASGQLVTSDIDPQVEQGLRLGKQVCLAHTKQENCEAKPYAVAMHWRGTEPSERRYVAPVKQQWEELCKQYALEIHPFDGGLELRPKGRNKGDVVKQLLSEISHSDAVIYLGDDQTDEEAFAVLGDRGLKVLVRKQQRPTLADVHLVPPEELLSFLRQCGGTNDPVF